MTLVGSTASDNGQETTQTPTVKEAPVEETEKPSEKQQQPKPMEKQAATHHRVSISKPDIDKKMERTISEDTEGKKNYLIIYFLFNY